RCQSPRLGQLKGDQRHSYCKSTRSKSTIGEHNDGPTTDAGLEKQCSKIVWLCNDLRVPWPGARIIYADPPPFNTKSRRNTRFFLGRFTYSSLVSAAALGRKHPCSKPSAFVPPF